MIIGACGFGGTGSSAIKDYLKEFNNIQVLDQAEFQKAFEVDGIQDLEFHLYKQYARHMSGDIALQRFLKSANYAKVPFVKKIYPNKTEYLSLTREYVQSLTQGEWNGLDNFDFQNGTLISNILKLGMKKFVIPYYEKVTGRLYTFWPMRTSRVSIKPERFYSKTKEYVNSILELSGADLSKMVVLDQPFEGNNPTQSFKFFENPYAIVIDRDPRDLYLAASYQWPDGTFMPRRNPEAFVEYYKRQRENIDYSMDSDRVLRLNLESLIFDYDHSTNKVNDFLELDKKNHINKFKYFDPKKSIKGSQLYKKIPGHEDEIEYISRELQEYLFDFESYDLSKNNTEVNKGFNWSDNP